MLTITIPRFEYQLLLKEKREVDPEFRFWVSQDICNVPKTVSCRELPSGSSIKLTFPTTSALAVPGDCISLQERIQNGYFSVDVFSWIEVKNGDGCRNQAGHVKIPLYELLRRTDVTADRQFTLSVAAWGDPNLRGANTDDEVDNVKGTLIFRGVSVTLNGVPVPPLPESEILFHRQVQETKTQLFFHYMGSCVNMFRQIGYTWNSIKDINSYVFQSPADILPAAAYLGTRLGGTSAAYFENAGKTVLRRYFSESEVQSFDWTRQRRGPEMLARVLTLAANLMVYIPDVIFLPSRKKRRKFLKRALESFDYARTRGGGDCEDLALEIVLEAAELSALSRGGGGGDLSLSPFVQSMIRLRRCYIFCMALGGVKSAEITGEFGGAAGPPSAEAEQQRFNAHMWSIMIPRHLFLEWWQRGNLSSSDDDTIRNALFPPASLDYDKSICSVPLILEGTGFLHPAPVAASNKETHEFRKRLYELFASSPHNSFGGMHKYHSYERGESDASAFYRRISILFTNEFLPGVLPAGSAVENQHVCFAMCRRPAAAAAGGGMISMTTTAARPTVGVTFQEFIASDNPNSICLWSEPPIDSTESACIIDTMKDLYPMPALDPVSDVEPRENVLIQRVQQEIPRVSPICATRGDQSSSSSSAASSSFIEIEFSLKSHLLTEERVRALIADCQALAPVIISFSCSPEPIARNHRLSAWRFVFQCRRLAVSTHESLVSEFRAKRKHSPLALQLIRHGLEEEDEDNNDTDDG